ncbi:threonine/serine exporter family protein, partial [Leuconostoc lactis]
NSKTPYAPEFIGGLAIGLFVLMCHGLFPQISTLSAILGAVMPLVPGLAMTNAIREIIMGDVLSGLVRAITALLVVSSLVAGVWIAFELVRFV